MKANNSARVYEPLVEPLRFTVECTAEVSEAAEDGQIRLRAFILLQCNGKPYPHELPFYDSVVDERAMFSRKLFLSDTLEVMKDKMPDWLLERANNYVRKAAATARKDSTYFPPRSRADWSYRKLRDAVFKASLTAAYRRDPLTLENIAAVISKRYKLKQPLTKDALRMLLKRHGVAWKEVKGLAKRENERVYGKNRSF